MVRAVMLVLSEKTFSWDWLEAARGSAQVIALESTSTIADWEPLESAPFLARNPEDPLHYRYVGGRKLPYRLLGKFADTLLVQRMSDILAALESTHGPIDVIHTHFYSGARFLPQVKERTGIPYVVTEHSTAITRESPDKQIGPRGLRIARRAYAEASTVMPVSDSLLRAILDHGLRGRFRVVDNPVDMRRFSPAQQPPGSPPIRLINVARLAAVKAHDLLLRSARTLRDEGYEITVTIIGDGPRRSELHQLLLDLDLADVVTFEGQRSRAEIADALRASHVFVLPSITENLPVAAIEAMASGLPVVATAVGGLPEMVIEGEDGHLVPPGDEQTWTATLRSVLDGESFDRIAIARRAHARYSFQHASEILEEVYAHATAARG